MKYLSKTVIGALASVALLAAASAASAQTVSPTGPVTASGQLTQSLVVFGTPTLTTVCNVTFTGTATSTGFNFTSYTGSTVSGPLSCNDGLVLPVQVNAVSSTQLNIPTLAVSTRLGTCSGSNINVPWNNGTSSATIPATTMQFCRLQGTLTLSPATTIN